MGKKKEELDIDELDLDIPGFKTIEITAQVWKRGIAFIIDIFILNITIAAPFQKLLMRLMNINDSTELLARIGESQMSPTVVIIATALSFLYLSYFVILESTLGQTLGKKLLGIYARSTKKAVKKHERITFWQAVVRNLAILPFFPFYLMWVVDPIYLVIKKERLSDRIARTGVFEQSRK